MTSAIGQMLAASLGSALQTVTVEIPSGTRTQYGDPNYGSPVSYSAWVLPKPREVRTATGEERVSSVEVVFNSGAAAPPAITPESRITLPDGTQPPILRVESIKDHLGDRQVVVYV